MAWKNQGGGPWGSGPKGPWGSGPQPVGPRPPDLEDLLRRGQDRLQQLLPGGYFSGLGIALIVVGALAIWGMSGFYRVQSEELGIVLRFGKYVRDAQPGLNYHLPYPIESVLLQYGLDEARVRAAADARGLPVCVMTFEPHPREFFNPASAPPRIAMLPSLVRGSVQSSTWWEK